MTTANRAAFFVFTTLLGIGCSSIKDDIFSRNPTIVHLTPENGATDISTGEKISILFSETIATSSLNVQTSEESCQGSIQISTDNFKSCIGAKLDLSNNPTIIVTPAIPLIKSRSYRVRVTSDIRNLANRAMTDEYLQDTGFSISKSKGWLYLPDVGGNAVKLYTIDSGTGQLASNPPFSFSTSQPRGLAIDPKGKYLYVARNGGIDILKVDPTSGTLASAAPATYLNGTVNRAACMDSLGQHLFIGTGTGVLQHFKISDTGNLSLVNSIAISSNISYCTVHPNDKIIFALDTLADYVASITLNTQTGSLQMATMMAGFGNPNTAIVDGRGNYLYVATNSNIFRSLTVSSETGNLTSYQTISTVFASVDSVILDRTEKFLYAFSDAGSINVYSRDQRNGQLTELPSLSITPSANFGLLAILDPSNRYIYSSMIADCTMLRIDASIGIIQGLTPVNFVTGASNPQRPLIF